MRTHASWIAMIALVLSTVKIMSTAGSMPGAYLPNYYWGLGVFAASALPQLRKLYFHSVFASSKNISDILAGALSDHKWPLLQSLTIHKEAGVNIVGDELTPEHDKVKGPTSTVCAYAPGVQVCRLDFDIFSTADIHTGTAGDARVLQEWVSQA